MRWEILGDFGLTFIECSKREKFEKQGAAEPQCNAMCGVHGGRTVRRCSRSHGMASRRTSHRAQTALVGGGRWLGG